MCRFVGVALALLLCPAVAAAQDLRESWTAGVAGAAGFPPALRAVRFGAALGPKAGVDVLVGRFAGVEGEVAGDGFGRVYVSQLRWMRRGRAPSGASRYWIFGALATHARFSTEVRYPGGVIRYLVDDRTLVAPRLGYGWDQITHHGLRAGFEFTTGAAREEVPFVFASFFVMWGPPRH